MFADGNAGVGFFIFFKTRSTTKVFSPASTRRESVEEWSVSNEALSFSLPSHVLSFLSQQTLSFFRVRREPRLKVAGGGVGFVSSLALPLVEGGQVNVEEESLVRV